MTPDSSKTIINVFSCDVEDWYWSVYKRSPNATSRCYENVARCLELLDEVGVRGTFFILGCVAAQQPSVVKLIDKQGHEIGTHGHTHKSVNAMSRQELKHEIRTSCERLQDITGKKVRAFRAPNFSITNDHFWAFSVLAECGIDIDSSIFPLRMRRYGNPGLSLAPFRVGPQGTVYEFPVSIVQVGNVKIPVAGGGYARLLPASFLKWSVRRVNSENRPFVLYCHPYEFSADEWKKIPEAIPMRTRILQGWGRRSHAEKLKALLQSSTFGPISKSLQSIEESFT
jgi:polysaccharide deacetylase family protein (PEP-CTERM system associated)